MNFPRTESTILYRYKNDPLAGFSRDSLIETLANRLKGRIEEGWIFGSFARNDFDRDSDIDIILVCKTERSFNERVRDFEDLYSLGPVLDILVYTPEEFSGLKNDPPVGFWRSVFDEMIRFL